MTSKVPPVPPANQTTKGTGDRKEVERDRIQSEQLQDHAANRLDDDAAE
jgi:hypothetical protein